MRKNMFGKGFVIVMLFLLVGTSVLPITRSLVLKKSSIVTFKEADHTVYGKLYINDAPQPNYPLKLEFQSAQYVNVTNSTGDYIINFTNHDWEVGYFFVFINGIWRRPNENQSILVDPDQTSYLINIIVNTSQEPEPPVVYVDDDYNESTWGWGWDRFDKIQNGINAVQENGDVYVYNGTYYEWMITISKTLNLIGEDKNTTVIDALYVDDAIYVSADFVSITGFKIQNSGMYYDYAGIRIYSSFNTIKNNIITNNYRDGIYLQLSSNNTITDNIISSNEENGIYFKYCFNNTVSNNTIIGSYIGVWIRYSENNTVSYNNISNNGVGVYFWSYSRSNIVLGNTISFNTGYGLNLRYTTNNLITENIISYADYYGFNFDHANSNIITENYIVNNNVHGMYIYDSTSNDNIIYNNYFNNTNNIYDKGNNTYNVTKTSGVNILGGAYLGGNYWHDYTGVDVDGDGLGDTDLPYNSSGNIQNGGDFLPLVNIPPYVPSDPDPANGSTNVPIDAILSWTGEDPDPGNIVTYDIYLGTTSPPPWRVSNQTETSYQPMPPLDYNTTYYWRIVSWDNHGASTSGPIWNFTTRGPNQPPDAPMINGPKSGIAGKSYSYTFISIDPEGDDVFYQIDWGDGQVHDWDGPYESNEIIIVNHTWEEQGTFTIKARAKDVYDAIGDWALYEVTMPKNKLIRFSLFLRFLERFPNAFPILRLLLGL